MSSFAHFARRANSAAKRCRGPCGRASQTNQRPLGLQHRVPPEHVQCRRHAIRDDGGPLGHEVGLAPRGGGLKELPHAEAAHLRDVQGPDGGTVRGRGGGGAAVAAEDVGDQGWVVEVLHLR